MSGFTKLVPEIIQSSIWNETAEIRCVWIAMIATKDESGYVRGDSRTIARMANVCVESAEKALELFQQPDPGSHTPDNEGRRIMAAPGGWIVLNHEIYRARDDVYRQKIRERVRKHRESKNLNENEDSEDVTLQETLQKRYPSASASASVSEEGESEGKIDWKMVLGHWNSLAKKTGLAGVSKLTDKRKQKYKARTDQGKKQDEFWKVVETELKMLGDFARGENNRGWQIDFDFIIRSEDSFTNLSEGKYRDKKAVIPVNRPKVRKLDGPSPTDMK